MSEVKKFKTESKRLLDLMINSIYTNREIFIRELISNASDAIDKYHYLSLNDEKLVKRNDYKIHISIDSVARSIMISDNGIGMTKEELMGNLGTIAKSGSLEFLKKINEAEKQEAIEIIGQFGVGFYSSFMVAKKVVVETKSPYEEQAYQFTSTGEDTYTLDKIEKSGVGTNITIYLRDSKEEEDYDIYLNEYEIMALVKKYSDYIRYPITMNVTNSIPLKDSEGNEIEGKFIDEVEEKTLNSMIPIWKKNKNEVSSEQLEEFYKTKFFDQTTPLLSSFVSVEGVISYNSLLFIPGSAPRDLYSDKYEKGLQLYAKGVFIMNSCKDLIPDYLRFVKGLVDSSDLSLNISREILQQDRQLVKISQNIEKKIINELEKLLKDNYDKYLEFFKIYGVNLKYGIYEGYGLKKDLLKDLIVYQSINSDKLITLSNYVENFKEGQEFIYYAVGKNKDSIMAMPQMDMIKKQGYDVLILSDDIDEFAINILQTYKDKKFKSISQGDFDVLSNEEKEHIEEITKVNQPLLEKMKELLHGEVDQVRLSKRLVDSPVCLVSGDNNVSLEMEKVINSMPGNDSKGYKATKILEINPNHNLFKALETIHLQDPDQLEKYASLLYSQALLLEGIPLENPAKFSNLMCELMVKATK